MMIMHGFTVILLNEILRSILFSAIWAARAPAFPYALCIILHIHVIIIRGQTSRAIVLRLQPSHRCARTAAAAGAKDCYEHLYM